VEQPIRAHFSPNVEKGTPSYERRKVKTVRHVAYMYRLILYCTNYLPLHQRALMFQELTYVYKWKLRQVIITVVN